MKFLLLAALAGLALASHTTEISTSAACNVADDCADYPCSDNVCRNAATISARSDVGNSYIRFNGADVALSLSPSPDTRLVVARINKETGAVAQDLLIEAVQNDVSLLGFNFTPDPIFVIVAVHWMERGIDGALQGTGSNIFGTLGCDMTDYSAQDNLPTTRTPWVCIAESDASSAVTESGPANYETPFAESAEVSVDYEGFCQYSLFRPGSLNCRKRARCSFCEEDFQCQSEQCDGNICAAHPLEIITDTVTPCFENCPNFLGHDFKGKCREDCEFCRHCRPGYYCIDGTTCVPFLGVCEECIWDGQCGPNALCFRDVDTGAGLADLCAPVDDPNALSNCTLCEECDFDTVNFNVDIEWDPDTGATGEFRNLGAFLDVGPLSLEFESYHTTTIAGGNCYVQLENAADANQACPPGYATTMIASQLQSHSLCAQICDENTRCEACGETCGSTGTQTFPLGLDRDGMEVTVCGSDSPP